MSPHEHHTKRRSASGASLAASWDHYLGSRGPRAHGDLLRLVDDHVRAEARRLLGRDHPLFEEVTQEALVGAAKRISTGERPDHPVAYVRKIVNNKVADLLRKETRRRDREREQWSPEIDSADASVSADWHDFLQTLRTIVSSDEFWTLILRYHFDYSYGEIGSLLDKEPNAIRQIAHRGRRKCREHLTRLEGRVPAWVFLPDTELSADDPASNDAETDAVGDGPGQREPRKPDPAERSRRPPAGSDSGRDAPAAPPAPASSAGRRRRRLRPDGVGRPYGSPTTVVPLALVIALPILFQVDRALDAAVDVSPTLTAEIIDTDLAEVAPPSGPTISVTASTAPTDQGEAPSTSADLTPTGSDPPTLDTSSTTTASGEPSTTATSTTVTSTTATSTVTSTTVLTTITSTPPSTSIVTTATTAAPSTTVVVPTGPPTTGVTTSTTTPSTTAATRPTTTSTTRATTTSVPTTEPTTTSTASGRPTTSGSDPGDDDDPIDT